MSPPRTVSRDVREAVDSHDHDPRTVSPLFIGVSPHATSEACCEEGSGRIALKTLLGSLAARCSGRSVASNRARRRREWLGVLAVPLRYGETGEAPESAPPASPTPPTYKRGLLFGENISVPGCQPERDAEGKTGQRSDKGSGLDGGSPGPKCVDCGSWYLYRLLFRRKNQLLGAVLEKSASCRPASGTARRTHWLSARLSKAVCRSVICCAVALLKGVQAMNADSRAARNGVRRLCLLGDEPHEYQTPVTWA